MSARWLAALVPRDWTPDQAVAAVRLLKAAQDAIWWVYGEAMVEVIGEIDPELEHLDDVLDPDAFDGFDGFDPQEPPYADLDDIPF